MKHWKREWEEAMLRSHEERMSRPVKELFPKGSEEPYTINCRNCRQPFNVMPIEGQRRVFCSRECQRIFYRK